MNSKRTLLLLCLGVTAASAFATFVHFWDAARFDSWTREDGPIENAQAILYALAFLAFATVVRRDRANRWAWLFAAAMFFCAGEEIDWGQNFLNFATPSDLNSVNIQHEANLHNVENIHGNIRTYGFLGLGALFVIAPVLENFSSRMSTLRTRSGFIKVPLLVAPLAAAAFGFMAVPRYIDWDAFDFDEVGELFSAMAMCVYGLATARAQAATPSGPETSSELQLEKPLVTADA